MMADLTDPPQPRTRGLLIGLGVGAPLVAIVGLWFLPMLHAQLVGGAGEFDARLRQEDAYMQALCTDALVVERDEGLCGCVFGAEFPALDCRAQFMEWSLQRQAQQCSDPRISAGALSFCACVEALEEARSTAETDREARHVVQRYARCAELEDALFLPTLDRLAPPAIQAP